MNTKMTSPWVGPLSNVLRKLVCHLVGRKRRPSNEDSPDTIFKLKEQSPQFPVMLRNAIEGKGKGRIVKTKTNFVSAL